MASRLGLGEFRNVYGSNGSNVTAGQQDYAERMNQIENQREAYYRKAGVAPGLPTMKGSYADPEVTGVGYNVLIKELGDHRVPENWVQHPVINTEVGSNPGAPLAWGSPENPDDVVAGYGYVACDTSDVEETFYYHSDHLGSTAYITDQKANVTQYDAYLPYGELLVDEHSSSADLPYKFNGKELDEETGLYYYGARYMNPIASIWYGVDPLTEKYPNVSAFVYCMGNPVKLVDPDGRYVAYDASDGKQYIYHNRRFNIRVYNDEGKVVGLKPVEVPKGSFMYQVLGALNSISKSKDPIVQKVFSVVTDINDKHCTTIARGYSPDGSDTQATDGAYKILISLNYSQDLKNDTRGELAQQTFAECLAHEIKHAYDHIKGINTNTLYPGHNFKFTEFSAVHFENLFRGDNKDPNHPKRLTYDGVDINDKSIPNLYRKAMLCEDWESAPEERR